MEAVPENPPTNMLGKGLDESEVIKAIEQAGYPLQTIIVNKLSKKFDLIEEEWTFIDDDLQKRRSIDIIASKRLYNEEEGIQKRIRPILSMLIECKKSETPYVFFVSKNHKIGNEFPFYAGLSKYELRVKSNDSYAPWHIDISDGLSLYEHPFMKKPLATCSVFTKCNRGKNHLECSGDESFNNLILPLLKSLYYFRKINKPPKTAEYFDFIATLAVGVVDAPMIGITSSEAGNKSILLPWVRVIRHQSDENEGWLQREKYLSIDIVHKDYFDTYVDKHVLPFSKEFSKKALVQHEVIAEGKGYAESISTNYHDLFNRLRLKK
ncbi:hypothetical protein C6988_03525 [Nitrosopumilus sp. b1]|uniref:hypothetical protein n=1 Tax=Nitrosopumilus sp. b1 TaxID=2109907 RepID=UPI0015F5D614|nr:hypothetical protein [Nitrosopumilus sp. b1]KAF6243326.1 hypothetical protein C6988_03525 [Nitrosopumilus sp. b1]